VISKKIILALSAGACLLALSAGLAWACTPQATFVLSPQTGLGGSPTFLSGEGAAPNVPVEIRWNGLSGPKMAETVSAANGSFAVEVNVPQAASGFYNIVAVPQAPDAAVARQPYQVSGAGSAASGNSELWRGFTSNSVSLDSPEPVTTPLPEGATWVGAGIALLAVGTAGAITAVAIGARKRSKARA